MIMRRLIWAFAVGVVLITIVVGTLSFAHSYAIPEDGKRCAPNFRKSKWPMCFGCVIATQEDLAAGLIGGAGALFAAWLAFDAVQEQLAEERERRRRQQAEAKETAVVCIAQPVHAAAGALFAIDNALRADESNEAYWDRLVWLSVEYVQTALDSFGVRESLPDLGMDDRLVYVAIMGTLSTFVNTSTQESPALTRVERLGAQRQPLMNIHTYLRVFDPQLADVYARDSKTTPTTKPPTESSSNASPP
jgi:hypothetical protein